MLDLHKSAEALKLNLQKKGITDIPSLDVAVVLDVSGSFRHAYDDGTVQKFLGRIIPFSMVMDQDKKVDVYTFANGFTHVGEVTPEDLEGFVEDEVMGVEEFGTGTEYAPVLHQVLKDFGWEKQGGLMGLFGGSKEKKRTLVFFLTDGENSDKRETSTVLDKSEARKDEVYYNFVAVGRNESDFPFLKKVADKYGTTGLSVIPSLSEFVHMSDDDLYDHFLGQELIDWLKSRK